ncbi:hypothetical protein OZX74_01695 [Bifidobacterium sp. ESL0798]|nr:hypothetical protein [Bifidobacterium sp. ESL0798]WEV74296.1 hypothetical protein OZX74_01695 [Bifidobacterium sp. ESL0798]
MRANLAPLRTLVVLIDSSSMGASSTGLSSGGVAGSQEGFATGLADVTS